MANIVPKEHLQVHRHPIESDKRLAWIIAADEKNLYNKYNKLSLIIADLHGQQSYDVLGFANDRSGKLRRTLGTITQH